MTLEQGERLAVRAVQLEELLACLECLLPQVGLITAGPPCQLLFRAGCSNSIVRLGVIEERARHEKVYRSLKTRSPAFGKPAVPVWYFGIAKPPREVGFGYRLVKQVHHECHGSFRTRSGEPPFIVEPGRTV